MKSKKIIITFIKKFVSSNVETGHALLTNQRKVKQKIFQRGEGLLSGMTKWVVFHLSFRAMSFPREIAI